MAKIEWDQSGEKIFETGLDRGVLYSPHHLYEVVDGDYVTWNHFRPMGFAWNGLVSVNENADGSSTSPVYFDGEKTIDIVTPGDFSASLKAITFPDEFLELSGYAEHVPGLLIDNQPRDVFGLSYRTLVGNDIESSELGYKLHVIYNLTATPDARSFNSMSSNVEPTDFGWNLTSKPEFISGYRAGSHFVFDSTKIRPEALAQIELMLYGDDTHPGRLPRVVELLYFTTVTIFDYGDGTWGAEGPDYFVSMLDDDTFQIDGANVVYLDANTYEISSTND